MNTLRIVEITTSKKSFKQRRSARWGAPRIYFHRKGESVVENFVSGRFNNPYKIFLQLGFVKAALDFAKLDDCSLVTWSQKAGCSCPCSPGFIVKKDSKGENVWGDDIHVTYEIVSDESPVMREPTAEELARLAALNPLPSSELLNPKAAEGAM